MSDNAEVNTIEPKTGLKYRLILVGAAVCLILMVLSLAQVIRSARSSYEERFERMARFEAIAVHAQIKSYLASINSLARFFDASEVVTRREFALFATSQLNYWPGIQALEWVPRVMKNQRKSVEREAKMVYPYFKFTMRSEKGVMIPSSQKSTYFPIFFLEPLQGNEAALGFDLASNPARLNAIMASRNSGKTTISERVVLVQEKQSQYGVLVSIPIYKKNVPLISSLQRTKHLKGFVLGVFRIYDVIKDALRHEPADINIRVIDITTPIEAKLLYERGKRTASILDQDQQRLIKTRTDRLSYKYRFKVENREWMIYLTPSPTFYKGLDIQTFLIFLLGFGIALMISIMLWAFRRND